MTRTVKNTLRHINLFTALNAEQIAKIERQCEWSKLPKGRVVVRQDDPSDAVYFIATGRVVAKIYSEDGKEVTFTEISAGGIVGEFSAIDKRPRSATVQTVVASNIAKLTSQEFRELIRTTPLLGYKMVEMLVEKNRALSERIYEFSTMSVRRRVCAELVRLAEEVSDENTVTIDPSPSQYQLSTRISTHREAVSREYSALAANGIIEAGRKKLTILDVAALRELALN